MTFWSGETLESKLAKLIEPFDPKRVDCAAYTLRVGREVYVSPSESESEQDPKKITIKQLAPDEAFTIPPGQLALLLTEEKVTVPPGSIAFISMKSGIKLRGLVNVSGFHVDPGYTGNLVFSVFNAGPKTIHLRRGEDCFLIWYANLDNEKSQKAKTVAGHQSITTDVVTKISGELMSFEGLNAKIKDLKSDYDDRIHKIERDHTIIKTVGMLLLGIVIAAAVTPFVKNAWEAGSLSIGSQSKGDAQKKADDQKSPAVAPPKLDQPPPN